jgi:hypothetical protein
MNVTFYNPQSGETLKHVTKPDGSRHLYVWKGDTTSRRQDHQHNVMTPYGSTSYVRDYGRRVVADNRAK